MRIKTKQQLISELKELRQQLVDMEGEHEKLLTKLDTLELSSIDAKDITTEHKQVRRSLTTNRKKIIKGPVYRKDWISGMEFRNGRNILLGWNL